MGLIKIGSHLKDSRFSDAFSKPQFPYRVVLISISISSDCRQTVN